MNEEKRLFERSVGRRLQPRSSNRL